MYPVATSFIPVTVAIVKFVETHGFSGSYPYWYLGVVPVKYLMGPVVPWVLILLHRLLPSLTFFDLSLFIVLASYFISATGWGFLAFKLSGQKRMGQVVFALSLVLPWHIFYSMAFGEVSSVLANSLTPWVLIAYAKFQISNFKLQIILPAVAFTLLLLVNSTAAVPAVVGMIILGVVGAKRWEEGLKQAGAVILLGWLLSLFWYGWGFWLAIWGAPSFGSRNAGGSLIWLLTLLRGFVPVFLAVFVVVFGLKRRGLFEKFVLSWLASFGFLTLVRFWADPSFWLDWTAWIGEVEIGLALVSLTAIKKRSANLYTETRLSISPHSGLRQWQIYELPRLILFGWLRHVFDWRRGYLQFAIVLIFVIYFLAGWTFAWQKKGMWLPRSDIDQTVDVEIARELERTAQPNQSVFLSGTTAFWLNSLTDIRQVRGGRDEVAGGSSWRELVWEVRTGANPHKSYEMLQTLGVDWVVVHTDDSKEFYHDFEFPQKFETVSQFQKIYEDNGNIIYKIK